MLEKLNEKSIENLVEAIISINDKTECCNFLEDLCTIAEIKAMAQRLEVAQLLSEKKTFSEIVEKTGASTATISRVNRCIMYGTGGYSHVLGKMEEE